MHRKTEKEKDKLARLINAHYDSKASFARAIHKTEQTVFNWLSGKSPVPATVWDHFELIKMKSVYE